MSRNMLSMGRIGFVTGDGETIMDAVRLKY